MALNVIWINISSSFMFAWLFRLCILELLSLCMLWLRCVRNWLKRHFKVCGSCQCEVQRRLLRVDYFSGSWTLLMWWLPVVILDLNGSNSSLMMCVVCCLFFRRSIVSNGCIWTLYYDTCKVTELYCITLSEEINSYINDRTNWCMISVMSGF